MRPFAARALLRSNAIAETPIAAVILGSDHLLPRIREVYGDHVSDFVRAAWHNTGPDWRPPFEVVRNSFGLGLVARRAWRAEEAISLLRWDAKSSTPTRWTVECGDGRHAQPLPFEVRYINHSCEPSVHFDLETGVLRALRDIEPGDELRYFYPSTEWSLAEAFECRCGSAECLGSITGAAGMPPQILKRHRLSPWIRQCLGTASPSLRQFR